MPEPAARDHQVRAHFRRKERDPKTGIDVSVSYNPDGEDGWPGAKSVIALVPGSDEAKELFDGADSHHGPLIFQLADEPAEPKPPATRTPAKSADSKES